VFGAKSEEKKGVRRKQGNRKGGWAIIPLNNPSVLKEKEKGSEGVKREGTRKKLTDV